ncbi:sensor histidine kinase [Kurthia zopfii]|uniref:histidine kinase n=1 Tax=Kurthia zopfii TaxID=1650 RepID=A0A8B4QCZ6_9BACL|nr:GAF domain-containing sensor histidine kinase [Kurthia zopfii]PWI23842.1 histidine kinase [Kurthia zopfii]TDR43419.1 two-component system NarL family sensor kinase [Kurthia zopfii]GEK31559.1 sensor histidine kinase [Kurthia zopfii]STX10673.1 Sensor protein degS [Kurthia zopfii]
MKETDHSDISLLKEIAELLNEETEVKPMLQLAMKKLLDGTNFETGWIFFIKDRRRHELIAHENLPDTLAQDSCRYLCKGGCWCLSKYHNNELEKASNIIECQRIDLANKNLEQQISNITHHATVPLQSGDEKFGLLNVASPNTVRFSDDDLALLESVAFQLGSAIKRILLTKQEQEMALVQERNRLARDLHDSVNQLLFSVTLTSRAGAEMSDEPLIKETFTEIQSLTQEALTEMRALIWQLRPKGLESGLLEAIKGYADMLGLHLDLKVSGVLQFSSKIEESLFRIAQEALNNIRKHSGTKDAQMILRVTQSDILLVIKDEGRGFSFDPAIALPSMGLQSMRDRTEALGGKIDWVSDIGKGTEILIRMPY